MVVVNLSTFVLFLLATFPTSSSPRPILVVPPSSPFVTHHTSAAFTPPSELYPAAPTSPPSNYQTSTAATVAARIAWLLLLLYLLTTTASDYFSPAVEALSNLLRLSPAVAGVTLLALGTGAPDVFSSVAAFTSSDSSGSVGFSSALGGALFVTTVVSGTASIVSAKACVRIHLFNFLRDALFLLVSIGILTAIAVDGKVHLWEAIMFLCLYAVYAVAVWLTGFLESRRTNGLGPEPSVADPLLQKGERSGRLHPVHHDVRFPGELDKGETLTSRYKHYFVLLYKYGIELPLDLPRRLTIPVVEEERWCRPMAIASSTIAPIFVAAVWIFEYGSSFTSFWIFAGVSHVLALTLGLLAFFNTENTRPPVRFLGVWLLGSFVMSIVWFELAATEIVQTLSSLGNTFEVDTDILGITVLAWGNSIGDLVADLTLACRGVEGAQIAICGCYAGPLFIIVFGLGVSLVVACCKSKSETLLMSDDPSLFYISGFLAAALTWALLILPLRGMRLSRTFGAGLILLYSSFLVAATCYAIGWISQ